MEGVACLVIIPASPSAAPERIPPPGHEIAAQKVLLVPQADLKGQA